MKQLATVLLVATTFGTQAQTITQSGFSFSPNLLTVTVGTTITFTIGSPHNATQVSEAVWNANGTTPLPGGFLFSAGTHQFTPTVPGTYYYLCTVHPSMMTGQIIVETNTGVGQNAVVAPFALFPNPAKDEVTVTAATGQGFLLSIVDVRGREVMRAALSGNDRLDVDKLPEGNYTALLLDAQGIIRERKQLAIVR
ncbi:MAG: T9SS type A sorting domain-containing protein [Flavobacteriales bacterium]|nr:T9SS type A sorting domain-containing protein [Flavobacteriales bacterium]